MENNTVQIRLLKAAELQFRLASAVRSATATKRQPLDLPLVWSHGKHKVEYDEIALTPEEADYAACSLHRAAIYLMAAQIRDAVISTVPNAKEHPDPEVRAAYQISRLIRNAFAHHPLYPTWSIDDDCRNRKFTVRDIIQLDTTSLHNKRLDWRDYGGPLALLRLSQFVRYRVLGDVHLRGEDDNSRRAKLPPSIKYYQQGNLLLWPRD
jgi:hypothetical protein